jgi:hypothetical protein
MTTTTATRTTPARPEQANRPRTPSRQNAPTCLPSDRPTRAMQRRLVAHLVG